MSKTKRRVISSLTTLAMVFSLGAANTLEAYDAIGNEPTMIDLECNRIEELPDGGKIYIYIIDGQEHKFPVPPEGFKPLTATDEQLETYGFPPRPDKDNQEDYEDWVEIMSSCKSASVPNLRQVIENEESEDNSISALSVSNSLSQRAAGYSALEFTNFYSQVQGDFVQPTIVYAPGNCVNTFMVGFGDLYYQHTYSKPAAVAGTRCEGKGQAYAYYECRGVGVKNTTKVLSNVKVNPGDKVHVYVAYQKANNAFNYYIVNVTTGEYANDVITFNHSNYYSGTNASWYAGRELNSSGSWRGLGQFTNVTFTNCKAMLNTSTTWTSLGDLTTVSKYSMCDDEVSPAIAGPGNIVNKEQFTCTWVSLY